MVFAVFAQTGLPKALENPFAALGVAGALLLLFIYGERERRADQRRAHAEAIDAERRIASIHQRHAELAERRAETAEKALESSVEHGRLTMSLLTALRNVKDAEPPGAGG